MSRVRSSVGRRFRSVYSPALGGMAASLSLACGGGAEPELQLSQSELTTPAFAGVASCDGLLPRFKASLLEQVELIADQARANPYPSVPPFGAPLLAARSARSSAPPAAPNSSPPRFSTTTQTVPGVDPADLIKAEGNRIYLVHDRSLLILDASDAADLELLATVPLGEGSPMELLVHEGQVAVFSNVYEPLSDAPSVLDPYLYPTSFAKLTLVDATGSAPSISRESYFEGSYYLAGRTGSLVRSFIQQSTSVALDYPPVSYVDIFGDPRSQEDIDRQIELWVELTTETIEESTIEDYLPEQYERVGGQLRSVPVSCSSLVLAENGQSLAGGSTILSLDLAASDLSPSLLPLFGSYLQGAALSENTAVLVEQVYDITGAPADVRAILHALEFDGVAGSYLGSVSAPGYLTGAIGVDDASGVISTVLVRDIYDSQQLFQRSASQLHTFGLRQGTLAELGRTAELPGDYAQASRFDGERAYLSSYANAGSQLLVVDLSDPSAPALTGSLDVGSSSSVLVPFGSDQLLTITQSADPVTFATQYALQLLDVQDPSAPAFGARLALGTDVYSEALYDPRAFSFHPDESVFSLPLQSFVDGSSSLAVFELSDSGLSRLGSVAHQRNEPTLLECLTLLGYPTDPDFVEGLSEDLISLLLQDCNYYRLGTMRRGLFRADEAFALSTVALTAHALGALAEPPLSQVELLLPASYVSGPVPLPAPVPVPIDVVPATPESAPAEE